jgi:hypothetical protein
VLLQPVEYGQYTSIRYTDTLALEGLQPSIGSVGDAYDCQSFSVESAVDSEVLAVVA